jgi:Domain of unknown function (DUF397)
MSRPVWRKSSRSDTQGNDCVEVTRLPTRIGVRDSKNPAAAGHLTLTLEAFAALVTRLKCSDPNP